MATLHQLNTETKLANCLKLLAAGDSLVLIESGVALVAKVNFLPQLPTGINVLVLKSDLQARGLLATCPSSIRVISDAEWVEVSLEADRVCSW